jgi:hypothetical protein
MSGEILDAGQKWTYTQNSTDRFSIRSEQLEKPQRALLHYDDKA